MERKINGSGIYVITNKDQLPSIIVTPTLLTSYKRANLSDITRYSREK